MKTIDYYKSNPLCRDRECANYNAQGTPEYEIWQGSGCKEPCALNRKNCPSYRPKWYVRLKIEGCSTCAKLNSICNKTEKCDKAEGWGSNNLSWYKPKLYIRLFNWRKGWLK